MNKMTQLLVVYAAAAHMFHSMMAVVIESRKRKCHNHAPMGRISYAPIEDRDRSRIDYLNNKIWKNDVIFCAEFSSQTCDGEKRHLPVLKMFISITMLKLLMIISRSI
jgi:hypothetical protein